MAIRDTQTSENVSVSTKGKIRVTQEEVVVATKAKTVSNIRVTQEEVIVSVKSTASPAGHTRVTQEAVFVSNKQPGKIRCTQECIIIGIPSISTRIQPNVFIVT